MIQFNHKKTKQTKQDSYFDETNEKPMDQVLK